METQISTLDFELNKMILVGNALEAFEKFYSEDIVMQENDQEPTVGKENNRQREQVFLGSISEWKAAEVVHSATGENVSFNLFRLAFVHDEWGEVDYHQVAVREWNDDKVVKETFYYSLI